jgi:mannitol/fructose-specific phosphotransferase system IIA component (Ntr-type)/NhaP-type Na+/H+ or K+/H+ antiporter
LLALPFDPSPILVLALVLVAGLSFGALSRLVHLPSVTGQIVIGVLLGPSVLGVFSASQAHGLESITHFALALIAVAVGSHLHVQRLRNAKLRLFTMLLAESTILPAIVFVAVYSATSVHWSFAMLIAALAISTAPATIMALVKENRARGVFVKTLVASVALNNIACISAFEMAHLAARVSLDPTSQAGVAQVFLAPLRQLAMATLLGGGAGLLLILMTRRVLRSDLLATYSLVSILLTTGLAQALEISSLLSCLVLGVTLANVTPNKEEIGHTVFDNFEKVIYAAFFTLAGTELHLEAAVAGGLITVVAVLARIAGKAAAGWTAMTLGRAPDPVRNYLGVALLPQAGVAVGLVLVAQEDPALQSIHTLLLAVGLSVVAVNEIIGPVLTRVALRRSGDAGRDRPHLIDFLQEEHITIDLQGPTKEKAIRQLVDLLASSHPSDIDRDSLYESVLQREADVSTCIGSGLAIPHGELPPGNPFMGVVGISREGLHIETPDHHPVHCMVLLATPQDQRDRHLEVLAALAKTLGSDPALRSQLFAARSAAHVCEIFRAGTFEDLNYILEEEEAT